MEVAQEGIDYGMEPAELSSEAAIPVRRIAGLSGFQAHRRMSGVHTLSAFENRKFPITDEVTLQKFDALIDQFPKAPTNLEPNRPPSANNTAKQGWGFKGLAERFFSNSK